MATELAKLTESEISTKNKELADAFWQLGIIKSNKKEVMNDFKTRLDAQENLIGKLSDEIRSGKAVRTRTFFDEDIEEE